MLKLNSIYLFFFLAAVFFIAKPFVGFKFEAAFGNATKGKSIFVKSFTKRKPESINEDKVAASLFSKSLRHPPFVEIFTIFNLLAILFSASVFSIFFTKTVKSDDEHQPRFIYLLTGQLVI